MPRQCPLLLLLRHLELQNSGTHGHGTWRLLISSYDLKLDTRPSMPRQCPLLPQTFLLLLYSQGISGVQSLYLYVCSLLEDLYYYLRVSKPSKCNDIKKALEAKCYAIRMAKETYSYGKRDQFIWQKRPIRMAKDELRIRHSMPLQVH